MPDHHRTRTRGAFSALTVNASHKTSGVTSSQTHVTSAIYGSYETMVDVVTPTFYVRRKKGEIVNNGFSRKVIQRTLTGSSAGYTHSGGDYHRYSGPFIALTCGPAPETRLYSRAEVDSLVVEAATSAAANVAAPTTQALVSLGEFRETIRLFRAPLQNLHRFLDGVQKDMKRSRKALLARDAKGKTYTLRAYLEDEWMKYRYGIRPIVYEMQATFKAVMEIVVKDYQPRLTSRATRGGSRSSPYTGLYDDGTFTGTFSGSISHDVRVRSGVLYAYDTAYQSMTSKLGLRPGDIPVALWNLTTLSFVVDWVLNVSDYIAALVPTVGVDRLATWYAVTDKLSVERILGSSSMKAGFISAGWTPDTVPTGTSTLDVLEKYRRPSSPVGLTYKVGSVQRVAESVRILDLAILLQQRLK